MAGLLAKFENYKKLINFTICYELENGAKIKYIYKKENFPHLIGLHKLVDLPLIQRFNDPKNHIINSKYIISKIKQSKLTEIDVKSSCYYNKIVDRYSHFNAENLMSLTYTEVVIDFDRSLLRNSKLYKTKYILFEKENSEYRHLCIAKDASKYYIESFFYEKSNDYINNQKIVKVKSVQIFDSKGNLYLEDTFF
ncbi:PBECR4 domain-containing protein [Anaerovorax odorimutans]|uniref:PBECR4 domain-containing protein n=1 Tax=Anaerovorax odorimutans TaxID=109327 RepID=UPI0004217E32|nr:PBECR4 domain-containing protein [Anaerovorax odorimutans]